MSQHEVISVLAGGWSARHHDVHRLPGTVIGCNDAALFGRCDIAISMDRLWTEYRWDRLISLHIPTWIRDAALKNIPPNWPGWLNRFACDHESSIMSDEPGVLNGTNTGLCAVNLAYQFRPRRLYLYGMDLVVGPHGERHWYPDYEFKPKGSGTSSGTFAKWRQDLNRALKQCQVVGIETNIMTAKTKAA